MTEGWQRKRLGDVCRVEKTKHSGNNLPFVGLEDIESGTGRYLGELVPKSVESSSFHFSPNHLLFGRLRPYLNKVLKPSFEGHCSSEVFPIRPYSSIDRGFLQYWLMSDPIVREIDRTSTGARMPRANVNAVLDFEVPVPPLAEQMRIVAILDEAFEGVDRAIANTKKNLANARELFESHLNAIFLSRNEDWLDAKFGDLCDFFNGFAFKSSDAIDQSNVQLIRMGNLYQNVLDLSRKPSFYPEDFANEFDRYVLKQGDIIMSLTGTVDKEDYGYAVKVPKTDKILLLNQRITKIIVNRTDLVDRNLLLYFLHSRVFLEELYATARGVRQANLSTETMKQMQLSLPPMEHQQQLVSQLDQLEASLRQLRDTYRKKQARLPNLKQSILQKAFSGELTAEPYSMLGEL